jgi:mRNA interferase RelE/StbE
MRYRLVLHRDAVGEIRKLPAEIRERVKRTIDALEEVPVPPRAARLRGRANAYRIRVGNYRILYEVHATEIVVYVIGIAHRKEVYKRLLRRR